MTKQKFTNITSKPSTHPMGYQHSNPLDAGHPTTKLKPTLGQAPLNNAASYTLNAPLHGPHTNFDAALEGDHFVRRHTEANTSLVQQPAIKAKSRKSHPVNYFQINSFEPTRIEYPQESLHELPLFTVGEPKSIDYSVDTSASKQKNMIPMFQLVVYETHKKFERSNQLGISSDPHRTILSHICPPFAIGLNQAVDYAAGLLRTYDIEMLGQIRNYLENDRSVSKQLNYVYNIIKLAFNTLSSQASANLKKSMKDRGGYDHITILSPETLEDMINYSEQVIELAKTTKMIPHSWYIENYSQLANIYLELLFQLHSNNLASKENADKVLIQKYLNGTINLPYNASGPKSQNVLIQIIQKFTPSIQQDLRNLQAKNSDVIGVINAWTASYKLSLEQINNSQNAKNAEFNLQVAQEIDSKTTSNHLDIHNIVMNFCKKILKFGVDGRQNEQENMQPASHTSAKAQEQNPLKPTTSYRANEHSNRAPALADKNTNKQPGGFVTHVTRERMLSSRTNTRSV